MLIVALISVALLGFFPGMASDAQQTQSRMYWQSATPIAITEWAARYANDGVPPGYTHFYMRIRNTGSYPIWLTKLLANGRSTTDVLTGSGAARYHQHNWLSRAWRGKGNRLSLLFSLGSQYELH